MENVVQISDFLLKKEKKERIKYIERLMEDEEELASFCARILKSTSGTEEERRNFVSDIIQLKVDRMKLRILELYHASIPKQET